MAAAAATAVAALKVAPRKEGEEEEEEEEEDASGGSGLGARGPAARTRRALQGKEGRRQDEEADPRGKRPPRLAGRSLQTWSPMPRPLR
jgi:hypothetical protein